MRTLRRIIDPVKNIDLWDLQGVNAVVRQKVEALTNWLTSDKPISQKIQDVRETLTPAITQVMDAPLKGQTSTSNELGLATVEFGLNFVAPTVFAESNIAKAASTPRIVSNLRQVEVAKSGELTNAGHEVEKLSEAAQEVMDAAKGGMAKLSTLNPTHYVTKSESVMKRFVSGVKSDGAINESILYVEHNGSKFIVDGHHRFFAAEKLGIQYVPVQQVQLPFRGYQTTSDLILAGKQPGWWKFYKP